MISIIYILIYTTNFNSMPDTKPESPMAVVTAVPVMEMTRENVPAPGTAQWKNGVCGCCDHKGTNGEEAIEFLLKSTVVLTPFLYFLFYSCSFCCT